ncbi:MAG: SDR family NAD(P)-dependent oxidoreductase [Anaerolineae bacterium]|nr:SDR family NAD(P)-dependent oxidoreductase [Anaerolineae bacterium]
MPNLKHACAIVTGGASGIGRACAIRLAREGTRIVIGDVRDTEAQDTADLIHKNGGEAVAVHCDIGEEAQVEAMTQLAIDTFGSLDVLVANAGISTRAPLHELELADWQRVIRVNLTGTFLCARAALRYMVNHNGGSIVTIGSVQSFVFSGSGAASYKASKGGILMLTRDIAAEYGDYNIRANCVCPGWIDTPMVEHMQDESPTWVSKTSYQARTYSFENPIRRPADPMEVANVVAFLASEESSFMTGSAVMVDGGLTAI